MKRALAYGLLALLACRDSTTMGVRPELIPPADTDFGIVPVLNEKQLELGITNAGRADLEVRKVFLEADDGIFAIVSKPDVVGASETKDVVVQFIPKKEEDYSNVLVIETNDEARASVKVKLVGKGSTRAIMQVDPMVLDFGRVAECSAAVKNFTITSKGTADLIVQELKFEEGSDPAFTFVGSSKTPATVKFKDANGLPGKIQLTVKLTVPAGKSGMLTGGIRIKGTDPDNREFVLPVKAEVNRAPIPLIAPIGNGSPGLTVMLDGSGSSDPDMDNPLAFKWTMRNKPLSSDTVFASDTASTTSIRLDPLVPGAYEVQLDVTDSQNVKNCMPARATVVAAPAQKLLVEMFWDNSVTDIDLHVLRTATSKVGTVDDSYYANPNPDWGTVDAGVNDDPTFIRDALTGYGPELFGYVNPIDTTYRLVVEFANEHLTANPKSKVTVRVYLYGVVKGEFTRTLEKAGARWIVADVAWPSGVITPQ